MLTFTLYFVAACKDPGYVQNYVLRGEEIEDDNERAESKKYHDQSVLDKSNNKKNPKVKKVI
jgi:hypothetical protein